MAFWKTRNFQTVDGSSSTGVGFGASHNALPSALQTEHHSGAGHHEQSNGRPNQRRRAPRGFKAAKSLKNDQRVPETMSPTDVIIAVMGITGSGKTTFVSRCVGEDVGIGHDLHSYTQDIAIHSFRHQGRVIRLIDTPGFDDTSKADVAILNNIAFWLSHAYRAEPKLLLSGIIYLHPVSDTRMAGTATKNLEMMKCLCGMENLPVINLATTMWELVNPALANAREQELIRDDRFWGSLVRKGSKVCRHYDSDTSAFAIIDRIIATQWPTVLKIQTQMVEEHLHVDQTDAGRQLRRNVIREQEKVRDRLARNAEELEEMIAAQETACVDELLERQEENQRKLDEKSQSLEAMRLDMDRLREQKAQEFAQREEEFAREKEAQAAQMSLLNKQVEELQQQRDDAQKQLEEDAKNRKQLEDSNFQLMLQRDQAALVEIDRAIADRKVEEERLLQMRAVTAKKESIFKHTLKTAGAETLVHIGFHAVGHVVSAMCLVM